MNGSVLAVVSDVAVASVLAGLTSLFGSVEVCSGFDSLSGFEPLDGVTPGLTAPVVTVDETVLCVTVDEEDVDTVGVSL